MGRAYPLSAFSSRRYAMHRLMRRPSSWSTPKEPAGHGSICTCSKSSMPRRCMAARHSGSSFTADDRRERLAEQQRRTHALPTRPRADLSRGHRHHHLVGDEAAPSRSGARPAGRPHGRRWRRARMCAPSVFSGSCSRTCAKTAPSPNRASARASSDRARDLVRRSASRAGALQSAAPSVVLGHAALVEGDLDRARIRPGWRAR